MKFKTQFLFLITAFISFSIFPIYETSETKNLTDGQKVIESPVFSKKSSTDHTLELIQHKTKDKLSEKILKNWAHWSTKNTSTTEEAFLLFCYKINQSWIEERPDGYNIAFYNGHPVAAPKFRHIVHPVYFYTNDYSSLQANQIYELKKEAWFATGSATLSGAIIGALCSLCAHSLFVNKSSAPLDSKNVLMATIPAAFACAGMVFNMYRRWIKEYQELTEDKYLALKKGCPAMDCDDFELVHPPRNLYKKLCTFGGASAAIGLTIFIFKSLIDKARSQGSNLSNEH